MVEPVATAKAPSAADTSPNGSDPAPQNTADAMRIMAGSERLAQRRFVTLPISGAGAPRTESQGRQPGETTSVDSLTELIASISTIGLLQPILVEELPDGDRIVVAGERRLRSFRWLETNADDNPHIQNGIPAVVCPGPLTELERRTWQVAENLVRSDLAVGELGMALLFERCAVLIDELIAAKVPIPDEALTEPDPVARWKGLDRVRVEAGQHKIGAPWETVIARLGIQMSEAKAQQVARAISSLPADISAEMDAEQVSLHSRLQLVKLVARGRADAAAEIWAAVKARKRPDLLAGAAQAAVEHPNATPDEAINLAIDKRDAANASRSEAVSRRHEDERAQRADRAAATPSTTVRPDPDGHHHDTTDPADAEPPEPEHLDVDDTIDALRSTLGALRVGKRPNRYSANSLRLLTQEVTALLADDQDAS